MSSNIRIDKSCEHCGKTFEAKTTVTRYCSHQCASRAYKQRIRGEKLEKVETKPSISTKPIIATKTERDNLNIKEAAEWIGVSERTFYRMISNGMVKSVKLGGRTIIRKTTLEKLLES